MPDLTFFPDPNTDRVLGVVMELAAEVYALRERLRIVEEALESQGQVSRADLDAYQVPSERRAERLAARDAFIQSILAPLTYEADSPAPVYEPA